MTPDKPKQPPDYNDPDAQNAEQDDAGSQAQEVAEEALRQPYRDRESSGTEKVPNTDPTQLVPDDVPDLVDHMNEMDRSGRIDMDAYEGEDNMDDEDGSIPD
jgi:hypothetical protein